MVRVFKDKNQLAATLTASAFALIGQMWVTQGLILRLKSVHLNCILGRCIGVVSNCIATSPFFIFLIWPNE